MKDETSLSRPPTRHQFSLWQLLSIVSLAAVVLGLWRAFGGYSLLVVLVGCVLVLPCFWRPRWLYAWLLPLVWTSIAWINFSYPGDEYGGFGVGSLAGLWILFVLEPITNVNHMLPPILLAGAATAALSGALMDKLRAPWLVWLGLFVSAATVLYWWSFSSFPSAERALAKNGSYAAYILPTINLGLCFATIVMLAGTGIWRLCEWCRWRGAAVEKNSA